MVRAERATWGAPAAWERSRSPHALSALALVPAGLEPEVRAASGEFALRLECCTALDVFVARLETYCPELLLIDADLVGGCPADLCRFARSLRSDVKILALAWCWSDRDEGLRGCADGVLRKPPRRTTWSAVLEGMGLPCA